MSQVQPNAVPLSDELVLVIDREFDAPVQVVFDAWADPQQLVQWWGPEGMTTPVCEMDVRVGGAWKTVMRSSEGKDHTVSGVYKEIDPPHRLAFTWAWINDGVRGHETLVTIQLTDAGGKTRMHFEQRTFEETEHRVHHNQGWTSSFRSLEKYLASHC